MLMYNKYNKDKERERGDWRVCFSSYFPLNVILTLIQVRPCAASFYDDSWRYSSKFTFFAGNGGTVEKKLKRGTEAV